MASTTDWSAAAAATEARAGAVGARALELQELTQRYVPLPVFWTVALAAAITFFLLTWRLCAKTGHHGSLGLLMAVPGVNVFVLLFLAFTRWPVERELHARRRGRIWGPEPAPAGLACPL